MNEITEIFSPDRPLSDVITDLKEKSVELPSWSDLVKMYEPSLHEIVKDKTSRRDKVRKDGTTEIASRVAIGLEKLLVSRMTSFTFALPPKRVYHNTDGSDKRKLIAKALELIYKYARIDSENINRGKAYYASCEVFTIWYAVKSVNTLYGFKSNYKLKCKTYSPMDGVSLYPLFDELGDMIAMSFEYKQRVKDQEVVFFETFTADTHYKWMASGKGWKEVTKPEEIIIGKIPGVYGCRPTPVYYGLSNLRKEIEYALSRNSDIVAYNASPILKVAGNIQGTEEKGETRRVYRVESGGDVSYVSWSQANEALKYHVDTMMKMFFMQSQMPDISFDNMKGLGNIGYDARMTLLTDAHLKIGEESGAWIEFLERECNVIKAFLAAINSSLADEIDNVEVEHIITPFIQNDEKSDIDNAMSACGGKAIISQIEAIKRAGLSSDPEQTLKQIQKEEADANIARINSIMGESAV